MIEFQMLFLGVTDKNSVPSLQTDKVDNRYLVRFGFKMFCSSHIASIVVEKEDASWSAACFQIERFNIGKSSNQFMQTCNRL